MEIMFDNTFYLLAGVTYQFQNERHLAAFALAAQERNLSVLQSLLALVLGG